MPMVTSLGSLFSGKVPASLLISDPVLIARYQARCFDNPFVGTDTKNIDCRKQAASRPDVSSSNIITIADLA